MFGCPSKKVFEMTESVISVYPEIGSTDTTLFAIYRQCGFSGKICDEYEIPRVHLNYTENNSCKHYAGLNIVGLGKRSTFVIDKE